MKRFLILTALLFSAWPVSGQDADEPRTGVFTQTFEERSPLSDAQAMSRVTRWPTERMADYAIEEHRFQVIVPEGYDGSEPFGLLVFIHPNSEINIDRFYGRVIEDVLAKHKLIWVSYSNAGNEVMPNIRLGLALDAVHNMTRAYRIDTNRTYVSGLSGGGRMTCMAGLYYPQVFNGAVPIVGTLYFRDVKLPDDAALRELIRPKPPAGVAAWPRGLIQPSARQLKKMKREQRWVLLAGETDFNMPQMRAHFEQGFQRDGFERAHYLEVKGMGHNYPDAQWYDRAITLLDEVKHEGDAQPPDERTQRFAQKRLDVALRLVKRDRDRGVRALRLLIEDLPETAAATRARAELDRLETLEKEPASL